MAAAGFGISQLSGVWISGFSTAFNINPDGGGAGGSGDDGVGYTRPKTIREKLLEEQRKKLLSDTLLHMMMEDDEIILLLLRDQ